MRRGAFFFWELVVPTTPTATTFTIRVIAVMTDSTGGSMQCLCVAIAAGGAAMIDTPSALIRNARVWTVIRRIPIVCCVARYTVQAEHPGVEDRVTMTACAGGG